VLDPDGPIREADSSRTSRHVRKVPIGDIALSFDHPIATGEHLAVMVIRAAQLAAILLRIARGLRHADKGPSRP
jgi:hypothetical protein